MGDFYINNDYSYLFSSLNASSKNGNMSVPTINFSDYASLQNGSYYQLTKSYFEKYPEQGKRPGGVTTGEDDAKTLASIQGDSSKLSKSADALMTTGSKSLFAKTEIIEKNSDGTTTKKYDYDRDKIGSAIEKFVDDYNSLLESAGESDTKGILQATRNLVNGTKAYSGLLSKVGITIGENNKLEIDKDALNKGDITTLKSLFNGNSSFSYKVQAYASQIGYTAEREANKSNTYGVNGTFGNTYSSGSIYDSFL